MATQEEKSLSELESEAEHTRADLINTVDELQSRVSPHNLKEEMKAYARDTKDDLFRNLEQKARENPLATTALAAGLAYPVWRFLINVPAPVLLVGAGIAMSKFGPSRPVGATLQGVQGTSSNLSHTVDGLRETVSAAADQAKTSINSGVGAVSQAASAVTDAAASVRSTTSDMLAAATDTISQSYRGGMDAVSRTGDQVSSTLHQSKESFLGAIENHPLLVGGIGLAIGGIIAAALPVTQTENRLLGDTSDELKNRAATMATGGLQIARTAAGQAYQDSASRVREQGLTPDVVRQAIKSVGTEVKNVVEQATDALGE